MFGKDFMEQQQHGFLVIQRRGRVVIDNKNRQKVCLVYYNYCQKVKLAPKSMSLVISILFKLQEK